MASKEKLGRGSAAVVRLSVLLDEALSEHVRLRAFETRTSRSAYVRGLVQADVRRREEISAASGDRT